MPGPFNNYRHGAYKAADLIVLAIALPLLLFVALRAIRVPMTYDEVGSLTEYAMKGWSNIFLFEKVSANNHILNTIAMKLCLGVFGMGELSLRLPNILAYVMYIFFCWQILRMFRSQVLLITGFLLLNLHPYLLDFFGLARGYGMAIACMMGAVFYFLSFSQSWKLRQLRAAYIFAALACLSNMALLNFFIALTAIYVAMEWQNLAGKGYSKVLLKRIINVGLVMLGLFALIIGPAIKLRQSKELYFGGGRNFWAETVESLLKDLLYDGRYTEAVFPFIESFVAFVVITGLNVSLYHLFWKGKARFTLLTIICGLLFISAISTILQFHILGTLFLIQRTALFFLPLFILLLLAIVHILKGRRFHKLITYPFLAIFCIGLLLHFSNRANMRSTMDWPFNAGIHQVLDKLDAEAKTLGKAPAEIKVSASWIFAPTYFYYNVLSEKDIRKQYHWMPDEHEGFDYMYYYTDTDEDYSAVISGSKEIAAYPWAKTILYRKLP